MKKITLRRLVTLSMMIALSVGLHYLEGLIPNVVPLPGYRLGLSNIILLFVLYYFGGIDYIFVQIVKVFLVALISSGFSISFFMSFSGAILSTIVSLLLHYFIKPSIYGLSMTSSLFHVLGQLFAYAIFFKTFYIFEYLIVLGPMSILSGIIIAIIVAILIKRIPSPLKSENKKYRSD